MELVAQELSPLMVKFENDQVLDPQLFQRIEAVYKKRNSQQLTVEQRTILEEQYRNFVRNGALLDQQQKQHLREIDEQLAKLQVDFHKNSLQANKQISLPVVEEDLRGISEANWGIFREAAKERGEKGYVVTFDAPVYTLFMKGCKNRELREKLHLEYVQKATSGEFDNRQICQDILRLRRQRAELLGHPHHANFVLERCMAENAQTVVDFLEDLKGKVFARAEEEVAELAQYAQQQDGLEELRPWDFSFYSERYKKQLLDIDDEALRPYFQLENVIAGVFEVASRLYQLQFRENRDIPKYHPEVRAYEVIDAESSKVRGIFYADFFPRSGKKGGPGSAATGSNRPSKSPTSPSSATSPNPLRGGHPF